MNNQAVVRMATPEDMHKIKAIWRYAFTDGAPFVDWYFSHYAHTPEIVVAEWRGNVVASLQVITEVLEVQGEALRAGYIVGINTLPEARGQNLTRLMMDFVFHSYARANEIDLFLLMPFEAGFYYPYGFVFGTYHARLSLPIEEFVSGGSQAGHYERIALEEKTPDFSVLNKVYHSWQYRQSVFLLKRDARQWSGILDDLALEGGQVAFWHNDQGLVEGYLLYHLEGNQLHIREMAYITPAAQRALYYYVASHRSQAGRVMWSAPVNEWLVGHRKRDKDGISLHPFMMYRVQKVSCLGSFAVGVPDEDLYFALDEEDASVFCWKAGTREIQTAEASDRVPVLNRRELTEMVFDPEAYRFAWSAEEAGVRRALADLFKTPGNYVNVYF